MINYILERKSILIGIGLVLFIFSTILTSHADETHSETPLWTIPNIPSRTNCPPGNHSNCHTSSPVLVDITNDGKLDIVLATNNGWIMAVRHDGAELWRRDLAPYFGMSPGTQQINSSPAVADIDDDGRVEIVVGTGTLSPTTCTQGGVIVLDHNGQKEGGNWPYFAVDQGIPPAGCRDTIYATPALGDLDRDGDMEIVFGGLDKRLMALHHNGVPLSGFPVDSVHAERFPTWGNLTGLLADSIWSSPALADIDGDGYLDIIIGTDEGNFDQRFGGNAHGWTCPYSAPPGGTEGYCGGSLYVINRFGEQLPGFPKYTLEHIQSTPVIQDVNRDGNPEIFVGTGTYYHVFSPDHPTVGFRFYGWDSQGNALPGWEGGKVTGGGMPASPAIGDITGDNEPEILALSMDQKLYAWHINGTSVSGFPMKPVSESGHGSPYNVGLGLILGDYDGDGKMEIFVRTEGAINVIDGTGDQLTTTIYPPDAPHFYTWGLLQNNPAVGDLDNDGSLELVAYNSTLYAWDLPDAGNLADWPMFKRNAARTSNVIIPMLEVASSEIIVAQQMDTNTPAQTSMTLRAIGEDIISWDISLPAGVTSSRTSGRLAANESRTLTLSIDPLNSEGFHTVGSIQVHSLVNGVALVDSPESITVKALVGDISYTHLPTILK